MKQKILFILAGCFIAGIAMINTKIELAERNMNVSISDISVMALADGEGSGNQATCYSTHTHSSIFYQTTIWVCGTCMQENVRSYSDPGTCYF